MSDEQLMRQVFESYLRRHVDMSLWSLVRHAEHPREYAHRTTQYQWNSFQAGWQARDAEVQQLREQNVQYYDLLLVVALASDGHGWLNPDVSDRIDAVLAGEEATDE